MSTQTENKPSGWERSSFVRCCRWICSKRGIRRIGIVLAWVVTINFLIYGEENWRGHHAWNQYLQTPEGRGASQDYANYIPPTVPEDQNVAATPFLKSLIIDRNTPILTNDIYYRAGNYISDANLARDGGRRHFADLAAWQMASTALQGGPLKRDHYFETDQTDLATRAAAAPAVLAGMKPDEAVFAELRAAFTRKFSRFPVNYDLEQPWNTMVPHLAGVKGLCSRLNLMARAELAAGQSDQALSDVKLMLALGDSVKSEPFLISYLVRVACVQIAISPVWEGLAEHGWNDAQLKELQERFSAFDFLTDLERPLQAERADALLAADFMKRPGPGWLIPSGWCAREKLNYSVLFDVEMKGVMDLGSKTVSPATARSNAVELARQLPGLDAGSRVIAFLHSRLIASMMLPALDNAYAKTAAAQTAADQAAVACALERYRLANGQFPETLAALTPKFMSQLPHDVITGQPFKYRRTDDGQFVLYSVGWNEKDDGGVPGKHLFDQKQGDWVWSYPAK